jgi:hypothetical protein
MGMLSEGWVWMLTNDLSEALTESIDTQEIAEFDGLMFISGLWNRKWVVTASEINSYSSLDTFFYLSNKCPCLQRSLWLMATTTCTQGFVSILRSTCETKVLISLSPSVDPFQWNTLGLSYNGPNAYSCAEVLALGLNKVKQLSTEKKKRRKLTIKGGIGIG